jgi:hypothetical protein
VIKPKALKNDSLTPLSAESTFEFSLIKEKTQMQLESLKTISDTTKILCSKRSPPPLRQQLNGYFIETMQTQPTVKMVSVKKEEKIAIVTKETDELYN